jgi:hypothetical protein
MKLQVSVVAIAACVLVSGCAASSKTFYADAAKVKDTQLCRTFFDAADKGKQQFAFDVATEAQRRGLTAEKCRTKVDTENAVLVAAAVAATAVGVGIACRNGCAAPSGAGAYRPNYAGYTDVDCLGGTGNGPRFTPHHGPFPIDRYNDPYNLDGDGDGMACEAGEGGWGT